MGKQVDYKEIKTLQTKFVEDCDTIADRLIELRETFNSFSQLNSFTGEAATNAKNYVTEIHGNLITGFLTAIEMLQTSFEKALNEYKSDVDNSEQSKIKEDYLHELENKIQNSKSDYDEIHNENKKIIQNVQDLVSISCPSSGLFSSEISKSIKQISETVDHLLSYDGKTDKGVIESQTAIKALKDGISAASKAKDMSPETVNEMKASGWYGSIVASTSSVIERNDQLSKYGKIGEWLALAASRGYVKYGGKLGVTFSITRTRSGKLKGNYRFAIDDADELAKLAKILKLPKDSEVLEELANNNLSFAENTRKLRAIKREIYKLPDFQAYQNFRLKAAEVGEAKALGKTITTNFNSEVGKSVNILKAWDWKNQLKNFSDDFSKANQVGKTLKGIAVVGSVLSVASNVVDSQKDGFQLHDIADVTTDSAVDVGFNAGAAAVGATVGSAIIPPLGTVIGAGVGIGVGLITTSYKFGNPPKSLVNHTKDSIKSGTKWLGSQLSKVFW